jgi:oxygen-independent coproporphyrinogen-3 oxidase
MQPVARDLICRYDISGPRYTSYPTVPVWNSRFGETEFRNALRELDADDTPVAIYVHMPYCAAKCFYCGCNAFTTNRPEVIDRYLTALECELDMVLETIGTGRRVAQMHWGGGTPNLLSDAQLARAYGMFERRFSFTSDAELSIEADPRRSSRLQLTVLKGLGFNRISLGVQDLDSNVQEAIGRIQPETLVRDVCDGARAAGFKELNLDLIYGLPRQMNGSSTPIALPASATRICRWHGRTKS